MQKITVYLYYHQQDCHEKHQPNFELGFAQEKSFADLESTLEVESQLFPRQNLPGESEILSLLGIISVVIVIIAVVIAIIVIVVLHHKHKPLSLHVLQPNRPLFCP